MRKRQISSVNKSNRNLALMIVCFVLYSHSGWAQQNYNDIVNSLPEKVYLQLDNKVYTTDQTIWFKSIVTNAGDHAPTKLSKVLYVELISPDEIIVERKLIKLENGIGSGSFKLNEKHIEGTYLIRAFTKWNMNFDPGFIFKTYIWVFSSSNKWNESPINNITLVNREHNRRLLKASINPLLIDSLHAKKLKLFITINNKKDSLLLKKNRDDNYMLNYEVPDKCNFVTLQIQTDNLCNYSKTITLNSNNLDLQFFPESGELVHGLKSKVGFKALGFDGNGKYIKAVVVTQQGEFITNFESNELGMGFFILPKPDSTQTYIARLKLQSGEIRTVEYPLPPVAKKGTILSVFKQGDNIYITATSNYLKNDSVHFRASCRGVAYYDIKGYLKKHQLKFTLPVNLLPEGIIAFTMLDESNQLVVERLFFNERPDSRIKIKLATDKQSYQQRELTTLNIKTINNEERAIRANLSVLVFNSKQMGKVESNRQNILSYFLLSSDLKGRIEKPGFYFDKDNDRNRDLDALMLTQGWRKYNYSKPIDTTRYQPETSLSISGTVGGIISKRGKKEVHLSLISLGKPKYFYLQTTDSMGRFNFNISDEYGKDLKILIKSTNRSGRNRDYSIVLDKIVSPVIMFDHVNSVEKVDSTIQVLVEKNRERKRVEDSFRMSEGNTLLSEVVVKGYDMTPQRKLVTEKYGKPKIVISGKTLQAKEEEWSFGLYSVLMYHYADKVRIVQRGNNMYARVVGAPSYKPGDGVTLIVIDGIPVKEYDYPQIAGIPPSEVKSFEIIQSAKNFLQLYLEADPDVPILEAPTIGSVIAIYTHAGKGLHGVQKPVGLFHTEVPVFSRPNEFYSPKYTNISAIDWAKPDLRALVHWDSQIVADSLGECAITFYNADNIGEMKIVVEAISESGEIGYQELNFNVERNNH